MEWTQASLGKGQQFTPQLISLSEEQKIKHCRNHVLPKPWLKVH